MNKQELIEKWDYIYGYDPEPTYLQFINDLKSLDEPETLSQEWIDEHKVARINNLRKMTTDDVVPVEYLQNLLVPKQDERDQLEIAYKDILSRREFWFDDKRYVVVEKEQNYYVLDSEDIPLLEKANNQTCKTTTGLSIYEDGRDNSRFELTEQEIKDYDPRYMTFAKPVEELEEC